jgi:hypothetical protein
MLWNIRNCLENVTNVIEDMIDWNMIFVKGNTALSIKYVLYYNILVKNFTRYAYESGFWRLKKFQNLPYASSHNIVWETIHSDWIFHRIVLKLPPNVLLWIFGASGRSNEKFIQKKLTDWNLRHSSPDLIIYLPTFVSSIVDRTLNIIATVSIVGEVTMVRYCLREIPVRPII